MSPRGSSNPPLWQHEVSKLPVIKYEYVDKPSEEAGRFDVFRLPAILTQEKCEEKRCAGWKVVDLIRTWPMVASDK